VNDEKLKDITNVAKVFNHFCIKITVKLNIEQIEKGDVITTLKHSLTGKFLSIKIILITEADISRTVHSIKLNKIIRL
jgi:putative lipoic acid-binding regulatory protein